MQTEITEQKPATRPGYRPSPLLLILFWLIAFGAITVTNLIRPDLNIQLLPGAADFNLTGLNKLVTVSRAGLVEQKTGPGEGAVFYRIDSDQAKIRLKAINYNPVTLTLETRGAAAKVLINDKLIGTTTASTEFKTQQFSFIATKRFTDEVPLTWFTIQPQQGMVDIASANVDYSSQWNPYTSEKGSLLIYLLVSFGALAVASLLAALTENKILRGVALLTAVVALGVVVYGLNLIFAVGFSSEFNALPFWVIITALLYLGLFALVWGVAVIRLDTQGETLLLYTLPRWRQLAINRPILNAILVVLLVNTLLTVLFFSVVIILNGGWDQLSRFWDGPEYLVNAKTLYDPKDPMLQIPSFTIRSTPYWGAHFPGYSLLIRLFSPIWGYVAGMFIINFVSTVIFGVMFYKLLREFNYARYPLWITTIALFLPLRWLVYHSIGASEGLTLMFLVLAMYAFKKEQWLLAGLWGAGVTLTRPNGFFILGGFGLFLLWDCWLKYQASGKSTRYPKIQALIPYFNWRAAFSLLPIPLMLLAVFGLYGLRYGDFLAYLRIPEPVTHIYPIPFLSMDISVGRSEGDFYYFILETLGLILLWRQKNYDIFWMGFIWFLPTLFLLHEDVLRYSLPAFPFVLFIPFARYLETKYARWLALPALIAVLIYSWSTLNSSNIVDEDTWKRMLELLK